MNTASNGQAVKIHYTCALEDGTIIDSSKGLEPLEVTLGMDMVIPGFEKAILGMALDEHKIITVQPGEAYGEYQDTFIIELPKTMFSDANDCQPGLFVELEHPNGDLIYGKILEVTDTALKIDANHPLAGKALVFTIQLVEIIG